MVLSMPRPYPHPTTGVYWYRQRVPKALAAVAVGKTVSIAIDGKLSTPKIGSHLTISLGTKDQAVAKGRSGEAQAQFDLVWQSFTNAPVRLTHRQSVALAGEIYRAFSDALEEDPGTPEMWAEVARINANVAAGRTLFIGRDYGMERRFGPFVAAVLARRHLQVDAESHHRLLEQVAKAMQDAAALLERRAHGDYSPDPSSQRFPLFEAAPAAPVPQSTSEALTLTALLEHKQATQSKKPKTFAVYRSAIADFAKFTGHENARELKREDVRRWRDALIERGLATKTINDGYLAALKSALRHGVDEHGLTLNVADRLRDKRDNPDPVRPKWYTADDARTILEATFIGSTKQHSIPEQRALFWVPWICAYTGLRVGEVTQLQGCRLRTEDGISFLLITPEDGSTKGGNAWTTAIHPHLAELGLLDMFRAVGDGPAFYIPYPEGTDLRAIAGHRSKNSADAVARWVSDEVGINPPGGRANHAWRHTFTSLSRVHQMDKETRDYMMGSRSKTDAREGYGDWPPVAIDREIRKLPRFAVSETTWRPSSERVAPEAIKAPRRQTPILP
jgi:integrase